MFETKRQKKEHGQNKRFNAYGVDGGPAAKALRPKFDAFAQQVHSRVGFQLPDIDLLHQLITTPILYDFYNYDSEDKEFIQLFIKFTQNMALFGALLFFVGMKNTIPRRQPKKKAPKTKTY
ncbi:uncharacterized protein HKW66_Vig0051420 [Vigna angularis]|uniref:Uncharacterized protein n=1 Tax=Phaseolus angularis TaxID=3914 RepID=A0A8T0L115_PHAAN|nr:uncharacterized protein HKW66_Vig0051420 [Vigna angularis]